MKIFMLLFQYYLILGVFLRRMYLQYQRMSFTDTGNLGKSVESYLQLPKSDEIQGILPSTDTVDRQSYKRYVVLMPTNYLGSERYFRW